jgi:hypothetical protein
VPREYRPLKAERDGKLDEQQEMFGKKEASWVPDLHRTSSHLCFPYSRPVAWSLDSTAECRTPFREPLQFIVIAVMSVISGTFPATYGIFYVTINSWRVRGPSRRCHGERHGETPYLSGLLVAMTLMTVIYRLILDRECITTS